MTIQEILKTLGIRFVEGKEHHHSRQGWVNVDCVCGRGSQKFHLGYNLASGFFTCWKCGPKRIVPTLAVLSGHSDESVWRMTKGLKKIFNPEMQHTGILKLPSGIGELQPPHERYIRGRNLDLYEVVNRWGVKGIGLASRYAWRLFIPITLYGNTVSWTTRAIQKDAERRYLSAPSDCEAIPHKDLLYGEEYCHHTIIIQEGPLDVWATGPGATCTFGTEYTAKQIAKMAKYPRRVICYDSSDDAQQQAIKLCEELAVFPGETLNVKLETGKDSADAQKDEIAELRRRFLD